MVNEIDDLVFKALVTAWAGALGVRIPQTCSVAPPGPGGAYALAYVLFTTHHMSRKECSHVAPRVYDGEYTPDGDKVLDGVIEKCKRLLPIVEMNTADLLTQKWLAVINDSGRLDKPYKIVVKVGDDASA